MKRSAILFALLLVALVLGACTSAPTSVLTSALAPTSLPALTPAPALTNALTVPPTAPLPRPIPAAQSSNTELIVSAAADLQTAFTEIGAAFEKQTGTHVILNFGSTGQAAQQIAQGAPVDLFAAADRSYINDLAAHGQIISDTVQLYARGRITLWTRQDSTLQLNSLADLARPEIKRVAIANPDHAPYGVAAREALQHAGLWDVIQPKLILGENVAQTKQYAETGNVDAAIVALSLSVGAPGHWVLIPQEMHNPLDQALGVIKGAKNEPAARAFIAFVGSPTGRAVMVKYGFVLPGEEGKLPQ